MSVEKIAFDFDDEQFRQIEANAAKHQTWINALVRDYFAVVIASGIADDDGMTGNLRALVNYSAGRISRNKAKAALGVDDLTLTAMLRCAKFPPPRASLGHENRMLDEIKDIEFGSRAGTALFISCFLLTTTGPRHQISSPSPHRSFFWPLNAR